MSASFKCSYCGKSVPTVKGLRSHIAQRQPCRDALRRVAERQPPNVKSLHIHEDEEPTDDLQFDHVDEPMVFEPNRADEELDNSTSASPSRRTQMEEVEDEEAGGIRRYVEDYGQSAGHVYGEGQSQFMKWREAQKNAGHAPWSPYNDLDEWDLSQWLIRNVGQNATDEYLKLPIVSSSSKHNTEVDRLTFTNQTRNRTKPSFKNKRAFYKRIDTLPRGPKWECEELQIIGDERDDKGKLKSEVFQLWKRDPVECIKELIGNPGFRNHLRYSPQRAYEDENGETRIFDEMWTGDWWWNMQVSYFSRFL